MDKNATKLQIYVDTDKIPSYHPEALFKLARLNWSSIESLDADAISVSKDLHQAWFLNEIKDQRNAGSFLSYFKDKGPKIDKDLRESTCVIDKDLVQFRSAQLKYKVGDKIIATEHEAFYVIIDRNRQPIYFGDKGIITEVRAEDHNYRIKWDKADEAYLWFIDYVEENAELEEPPKLDVRELEYKGQLELKVGDEVRRKRRYTTVEVGVGEIGTVVTVIPEEKIAHIKWEGGHSEWYYLTPGFYTANEILPPDPDVPELEYKDIEEEKREDKSNGPSDGPEVTEDKVERAREAQRELKYKVGDRVKYIGTVQDLMDVNVAHGNEEAEEFYNKIKDKKGRVTERFTYGAQDEGTGYQVDFGEVVGSGMSTVWAYNENLLAPADPPETIEGVPELKYKGQREFKYKVGDKVEYVGTREDLRKINITEDDVEPILRSSPGVITEINERAMNGGISTPYEVRFKGVLGRGRYHDTYDYDEEHLRPIEPPEIIPDVQPLEYKGQKKVDWKIGDRIKTTDMYEGEVPKGTSGTVINVSERYFDVKWDTGPTYPTTYSYHYPERFEFVPSTVDVRPLEYKGQLEPRYKEGDKIIVTGELLVEWGIGEGGIGTIKEIDFTRDVDKYIYLVKWDKDGYVSRWTFDFLESGTKLLPETIDVPPLEYKGQYRFKVEDRVKRVGKLGFIPNETIGIVDEIKGEDVWVRWEGRMGRKVYSYLLEDLDSTEVLELMPDIIDVPDLPYIESQLELRVGDKIRRKEEHGTSIVEAGTVGEIIKIDADNYIRIRWKDGIKTTQSKELILLMNELISGPETIDVPELEYKDIDEKREGQKEFEYRVGDQFANEEGIIGRITRIEPDAVLPHFIEWEDGVFVWYNLRGGVNAKGWTYIEPTIDVPPLEYKGRKVQANFDFRVGDRVILIAKDYAIPKGSEVEIIERVRDDMSQNMYRAEWKDQELWFHELELMSPPKTIDVKELKYKGQAEPKYDVGDKLEFKSNIYHTTGTIKERIRDSVGLYRYFIEWKDSEGKDMPGGGWSYERHLKDSRHIPVPSTIDVKELKYKGQLEEPRFEVNDRVRMVDKEYGVDQGIPSGTPGTVLEIDSIEQQTYYRVRFDGVQYVSWYKSKRLGPVPPEIIDVPELEYKDIDEEKRESQHKLRVGDRIEALENHEYGDLFSIKIGDKGVITSIESQDMSFIRGKIRWDKDKTPFDRNLPSYKGDIKPLRIEGEGDYKFKELEYKGKKQARRYKLRPGDPVMNMFDTTVAGISPGAMGTIMRTEFPPETEAGFNPWYYVMFDQGGEKLWQEDHLKLIVPKTVDVKPLEYKEIDDEKREGQREWRVDDRVKALKQFEFGDYFMVNEGDTGTVANVQESLGAADVLWDKDPEKIGRPTIMNRDVELVPPPETVEGVPELPYIESSKRKAGTWELPDTIMKANALKRLIDSIKSDDVYKTEWVQDKLGSVYGDDSLYDDLDGNSHGEDEAREIDGGIAKDVIIENLRSTLDYYKESPEQFKKEFAPDVLDVLRGIVGLPSGFKELKYKGQVEPKFKKRDKVRTLIDAHSSVEPDPTPKGSIGGVRDVGIFNQKFICYVTFEDGESYWFYESDLEFFGPETIDVPPLEYKE